MRPDFTPRYTPIEEHGGYPVKRDDLFSIAGVRGGKVRTCWVLAEQSKVGLVTAGSRSSPQVNIVAHIAKRLDLPCRVHTPQGKLSPELEAAVATGADLVQHKAGYNSVIVARAREDAAARGWVEIPFGMECEAAVAQTSGQVGNLPLDIKRVVVPVGSGMSLAGIMTGLAKERPGLPVLGVKVGADPSKRLQKFGPLFGGGATLVDSGTDYAKPADECFLGDLLLDPHYEAKCIPFLEPGDLLWDVGIRQTSEALTKGK
jgi:1-aminocyclopropane-1-carboxylate deaminase/D-cysteine desulfhydrase-like pyridoxal-dependent ACC family enzyme